MANKVFYNKQFSNYLGEQRAILDVVGRFYVDPSPTPSPTPSITPTPTPTFPVQYVAAGRTTNRGAYSYDGLVWSALTSVNSLILSNQTPFTVLSNGNIWLIGAQQAVGFGNAIIYSYDGLSWNPTNANIFFTGLSQCENIAYGNNMFVAVSPNTNQQQLYSYDGITWSASTNANQILTG
jgi:hypothetical protein